MKKEDLPEVFQKRIERFNDLFTKGTEDHHDFEHHFDENGEPGLFKYEMFCIESALAFAELFPTKEKLDAFIELCNEDFKNNPPEKYNWEDDADYSERLARGLSFSDLMDYVEKRYPMNKVRFDEHSGNTMGVSWMLFRTYLEQPELVPYQHGSLAGLVGDAGYYDDRSDLPKD